jgi:benzoate membrane transport protein
MSKFEGISAADYRQTAVAGFVASGTGMLASTGVVLAGLAAVGATPSQGASSVFAMLVSYGLLAIALSWRFGMPLTIVWSTPGAALLVSSATLALPFEQAVAGFMVSALLIVLTGLWPTLGSLVGRIPPQLASAMLAGVIFSFCVAPFLETPAYPVVMVPVLVVWIALKRFAPLWAAPAAIVLGSAILLKTVDGVAITWGWPALEFVTPSFTPAIVFSIAIPLYVVTMASQNIPGVAIMKSYGYTVPFRTAMVTTGLASAVCSLFGGFNQNLAAITAALNANEHAHSDTHKRWLAAACGGVAYLLFAIGATAFVSLVLSTPRELLLGLAGLALLDTLASALTTAMSEQTLKLPALVTLATTASGITLAGVGAAFWALLLGLGLATVLKPRSN